MTADGASYHEILRRHKAYRLGYRLAWDQLLTRAMLGACARVLQDYYIRSAHRRGIDRGRTGMLTVIQRFGSGGS